MRSDKGQMGYLAQYKKRRWIICAILILGIVAFVSVGYWQTKSMKNLLTVMGILLSLPLAKMLSGLLVVLPVKPMDENHCKEIMEQFTTIGSDQFLWNLVLASTDKVRFFPCVACSDTKVYAWYRGKEEAVDQANARIYFSDLLKKNGHRVDFFMYTSEKEFLKAASNTDFSVTKEEEWERVMATILLYEM